MADDNTVCAAPLCNRSIADRLEAWEARGRNGRKPTYCEDPECVRARQTKSSRLTRRHKPKVRWHQRDTAVWREGELTVITEGGATGTDEKVEVSYVDPDTGREFSRGSPGRTEPEESGGGGKGLSYDPLAPRTAHGKPRKWVRERWPVAARAIERGEELPAERELREPQEASVRTTQAFHEHFGDEPWVRYESHIEVSGGKRTANIACMRVELVRWGLDRKTATEPQLRPWVTYTAEGPDSAS